MKSFGGRLGFVCRVSDVVMPVLILLYISWSWSSPKQSRVAADTYHEEFGQPTSKAIPKIIAKWEGKARLWDGIVLE